MGGAPIDLGRARQGERSRLAVVEAEVTFCPAQSRERQRLPRRCPD
jgi:hypothetical protein